MNACKSHKFFALQDKSWCSCGNDWDKVIQYGDSECGKTGGAWCNYVYQNNKVQKASYLPIGSYRDTSNRALRNGPHRYGYDAEKCRNDCKEYY